MGWVGAYLRLILRPRLWLGPPHPHDSVCGKENTVDDLEQARQAHQHAPYTHQEAIWVPRDTPPPTLDTEVCTPTLRAKVCKLHTPSSALPRYTPRIQPSQQLGIATPNAHHTHTDHTTMWHYSGLLFGRQAPSPQ